MTAHRACLVGVNDSGPSRAAVRWACIVADALDWRLVFVHFLPENATAADESAAKALLDAAAVNHPTANTALERGDVVDGLARLASPGDLIVVGTNKTGFVRGRALGSLGIRLASRSARSLAVIPDGQFASRHGVVLGVGSRPAPEHTVRAAGAAAQALRQDLVLVHVDDSSRPDAAAEAREHLATASALATALYPELVVRSRVLHRATSDGLLDASRSASLLVIENDSGDVAAIGPVAHDVLMNLGSPVLLSRADAASASIR